MTLDTAMPAHAEVGLNPGDGD